MRRDTVTLARHVLSTPPRRCGRQRCETWMQLRCGIIIFPKLIMLRSSRAPFTFEWQLLIRKSDCRRSKCQHSKDLEIFSPVFPNRHRIRSALICHSHIRRVSIAIHIFIIHPISPHAPSALNRSPRTSWWFHLFWWLRRLRCSVASARLPFSDLFGK